MRNKKKKKPITITFGGSSSIKTNKKELFIVQYNNVHTQPYAN